MAPKGFDPPGAPVGAVPAAPNDADPPPPDGWEEDTATTVDPSPVFEVTAAGAKPDTAPHDDASDPVVIVVEAVPWDPPESGVGVLAAVDPNVKAGCGAADSEVRADRVPPVAADDAGV